MGIRRQRGKEQGHFPAYEANPNGIDGAVLDALWSLRNSLVLMKDPGLGVTDSAAKWVLRFAIFNLWEMRCTDKFSSKRTWSKAAAENPDEKIYEHMIPISLISDTLLSPSCSRETFEDVIRNKIRSCIITREEDRLLERAGLRQRGPLESDPEDQLARYREVGIELQEEIEREQP